MTMSAPTVDEILETLPEGTKVTTFGPGALFDTVVVNLPCRGPVAGQCTPENCVNLNDPVAQAGCSLC
jgi:hypothetical protein